MTVVTIKQQKELIALWLAGEKEEVARRQHELGLSPRYAAKAADAQGLHRRSVGVRTWRDKRWEWAKQRGAVHV